VLVFFSFDALKNTFVSCWQLDHDFRRCGVVTLSVQDHTFSLGVVLLGGFGLVMVIGEWCELFCRGDGVFVVGVVWVCFLGW